MSPTAETALADEIDELGARLGLLIGELEPDALAPPTAVRLLGALARVCKHAATGEALVARRVDACKAHVAAGFRSTEELLGLLAGMSQGQAAKVVETGRRLAAHEQTATAVYEGRISVEQAHAITTAAEAVPGAEGELLAFAEQASLRRLEARARDVRLTADDDRLGRYERQRAARSVRHGIDDDGMGWGHWRLPPDDHAAVVNRLERQADHEYRKAYAAGRRESHDRYVADALTTLCTRRGGDEAASRDTRADVVIHVSLERVLGREPSADDRCMVRGGGPVPVERVHETLADNAFLKAVLHDGTDILRVQHFGRRRPAEIDTALEARAVLRDGDVLCSVEGCDQHLGIEWDHTQPLDEHGPTSTDNIEPLCRAHHREKTARDRRRHRGGPSPP